MGNTKAKFREIRAIIMEKPCLITIVHNFSISDDIKRKIFDIINAHAERRCMLQYDEQDMTNIILDNNSEEKIFIIKFIGHLGSMKTLQNVSSPIGDLVINDLEVPINRIVAMFTRKDEDYLAFDFLSEYRISEHMKK